MLDLHALAEVGYVDLDEAAKQMGWSKEATLAAAKSGRLRGVLVGGQRLVQPAIVTVR